LWFPKNFSRKQNSCAPRTLAKVSASASLLRKGGKSVFENIMVRFFNVEDKTFCFRLKIPVGQKMKIELYLDKNFIISWIQKYLQSF
jgi:hypothetical protein